MSLEQEKLLCRLTHRIQRSLPLKDLLTATVTDVRAFLDSDRVAVYQFHADESGQVIAESIRGDRLPSLLGLRLPAEDISADAQELLIESQVRSIVNVTSGQIGQSRWQNDETGFEPIQYRPAELDHLNPLNEMGVQSSLVVPIVSQNGLWGLVVSHYLESHDVLESDVQTVQWVVDQLSMAIAQSSLMRHVCEMTDREAAVQRISSLLHSLSTIELQAALEETVATLQGSGGRLWIQAEPLDVHKPPSPKSSIAPSNNIRLYTYGVQPNFPDEPPYHLIEQCSVWQTHFKLREAQVWAIDDLHYEPDFKEVKSAFSATSVRGVLMMPLWYRHRLLGYLSIFRTQVVSKQVHQWMPEDIELAQALGNQFATAFQQHEMHHQLHVLNASLEAQVIERTTQLQQATEQQRILFEVVTKMRQSLDFSTIFRTVTSELRRLLSADRVGVYRLDPNSNFNTGEFVAEEVLPGFLSALTVKIYDHCFGDTYATRYRQGRVHTVTDIHKAGIQDCFLETLDQFQIKALLTAPLIKGDELWGLLCVHQCSQAREWQPSEIQFVTQVAAQLGVGLEQADLLAHTQQQAEQLSQAFDNLRKTQSQLIQTEKMSNLGELVAGVAHEINNPVNFIYGNLNPVNDYARDLLTLVDTYQACYPNPTEKVAQQIDAIDLDFLTEDLPKTLTSMKVGADRIRQIVLSLRNFSRLDQSEMIPVNIHEGLDSTLLILQHRLKAKSDFVDIKLVRDYGDLPVVECYAGQLNQVFMNVINNAIDALEEHLDPVSVPMISIRTERLGSDRVVIRISDNGRGIPEDVKDKIFETFFTTKPIGKGTGIGLSISYEIVVEKHRGVFKCHSQPGHGTEFWIEIPIYSSQ